MIENKKIEGYLCAMTITTLDYLISKALNKKRAKIEIQKLLQLFKIAEVNSKVLDLSASSKFTDFEDAVQYYSAECKKVNGIVTRNIKDYKYAKLPIYNPEELLGIIVSGNSNLA